MPPIFFFSFWLKVSKKRNYNCMKPCIWLQFQSEKTVEIWLKKLDIATHLLCGFWSNTFGPTLPEMAVHSLALKLFLHKIKFLWLSPFLLAFLKNQGKRIYEEIYLSLGFIQPRQLINRWLHTKQIQSSI